MRVIEPVCSLVLACFFGAVGDDDAVIIEMVPFSVSREFSRGGTFFFGSVWLRLRNPRGYRIELLSFATGQVHSASHPFVKVV